MKPEDRPIMRQTARVQAVSELLREPLAMLPEFADQATIDLWATKGVGHWSEPAMLKSGGRPSGGAIAVVPIQGVLTKQTGGLMAMMFGGSSCDEIAATVAEFAAMPSVGAIVLDVHSPGGQCYGVAAAGEAIMAARQSKRVVAAVNSMAGSAAYWLASQAHEIVIEPNGLAGGIGIYITHEDDSQAMEDAGITTQVISAGRLKAEGIAGPLSDEAIEKAQAIVDEHYGRFVAAVSKGRGVTKAQVVKDFGEGLPMAAGAAVSAGLADRIGTLDDVLAKLGGGIKAASQRGRQLRAEQMGLTDRVG